MRLQCNILLFLTSALLASAGPFTISWWTGASSCDGRALRCRAYNAFQCCQEPPSPSSFPTVEVTSSRPTGVVVFTEVSQGGGCGLCESTGAINQCYRNAPFNTVFVASVTQCRASSARRGTVDMDGKVPATSHHRECNETVPINVAMVDGVEYDITGSDADRAKMMSDVMSLDTPAEDFAVKWAHLNRRELPDSDSPTPNVALT